jgi:hyperosmotically inducible protein
MPHELHPAMQVARPSAFYVNYKFLIYIDNFTLINWHSACDRTGGAAALNGLQIIRYLQEFLPMKKPIKHFVVTTLTATAMGLVLAGPVMAANPALQPTMLAANETMEHAEDAVTDTWITSKVKSTFLADTSLSGIDIKVETNKGVVALSGVVASDAERDLAIAKASEIKGVTAVAAEALKTAE